MIAPALVPLFILRVLLSGTCRESFQQMDPNRPSDFRAGHSANEGSRARGFRESDGARSHDQI